MSEQPGLLVHNAAEVVTVAGGIRRGSAQAEIGVIDGDGAVAAYEGRIVAVGQVGEVERRLEAMGIAASSLTRVDAQGGTVTPGLIDPHTHAIFAGTRQAEVDLRRRGHSYLEILAAGGGILQTVRETRAAPDEVLLANARRWLAEMVSHGVTTVEVKSGYGLSADEELRLLGLIGQLAAEGPLDIVPTFLGAHAVGPEFRGRDDAAAAYIENVIEEQLPRVVDQGIATSCDVFCERGVFDIDMSRRLLTRAKELGLGARLHADQLNATGGAELAAEIGALSADHLGGVSEDGIAALAATAESGHPTVATLLPISALLPRRAALRAGTLAGRARRSGRRRHGLQSRHVTGAERPARPLVRCSQAPTLSRGGHRSDDHQRRSGFGRRTDAWLTRGGQARRSCRLAA